MTHLREGDTATFLEGEFWCRRCNDRTPVHAIWFKVEEARYVTHTVAQAVCDECLEAAVASLESARTLRRRMGQKCTLVRVELLRPAEDTAG